MNEVCDQHYTTGSDLRFYSRQQEKIAELVIVEAEVVNFVECYN